jgi:hypothetical protein
MSKRRRTKDPLARMFLQVYHLNVLSMPRENVSCGELYVKRGKRVAPIAGALNELVEPAVTLPPIHRDEQLAELRGTISDGISVDFGLGLLEGFLGALGVAAGVVGDVSAGYRHHGVRRVRFRFEDATRDSIDPFAIGSALVDRRFRESHPWIGPGNRYFVSAGVVKARSISISAEDEHSDGVDAAASVAVAVDVDAAIELDRKSERELAFRGAKALAIGVELYDLRYDDDARCFVMGTEEVAERLRLGEGADLEPVFVADDDELLLELDEPLE